MEVEDKTVVIDEAVYVSSIMTRYRAISQTVRSR